MSSGKWRLLRIVILITFLAVCFFTVYIPHLTAVPPKQVAGWELNVTRDVTKYVNPANDTTIISGKELCEDPNTQLVIVVTSIPSSFKTRSAIRETWASHNVSSVKVGFLIGLSGNRTVQSAIEDESAEFKDIIQDNFVDSYNNLTLKSVVLLKWFTQHCPTPQYLMKADDDTFVDVKLLVRQLANYRPEQRLLGVLICRAKPISEVSSKWYSPKYMYQNQYYPNYLSGTAYIMSRDVVPKLYYSALDTPILYLEDIYITGICAQRAGIRPRNFNGFNYQRVGLECKPNVITNHRITPDEMRQLWAQRENCSSIVIRSTTPAPLKRRKIENICH